jgi:hypothetical protein
MIQHDFEAFARLMALLAETFNKDFTVQRVEIYARALAEYPIEIIAAAVDEGIRRLRFFPKPAELIELIEGSPDDQAEHSWGQFWLALNRSGTYRSLHCEDVILAETILNVRDCGGQGATNTRGSKRRAKVLPSGQALQ